MKDLFICLLLNLKTHGNIIAATLYQGGEFSTVEVEIEGTVYTVCISKQEKKNED